MFGWLKNWLIRREMAKIGSHPSQKNPSKDDLLAYTEEYLKRATKEHADTLRIAQRLNNANLMSLQTAQLKREIKEGLGEEEEEYEEDEADGDDFDTDSIAKSFLRPIVNKLAQNMGGGQSDSSSAEMQTSSQTPTAKEIRAIGEKKGILLDHYTDEQLVKYYPIAHNAGFI